MAQPLAGLETEADEAGPSGAVAFPAGTANSEEDLGVAVVMSDGTMCIREDEMRRIMQSLNSYIRDPMPFEKMVRLFVEPVYHRSDSRATCRALRKAARKQNLSKEALLRDIVWMVNLFVACGSNVSKMEERLDTQEFAMFKRLEKRYNLLEKATAGNVLTLSRVATTFYYATVYATVQLRDRLPVSLEEMCLKSPDYPVAMMSEAFLFLIPRGFDGEKDYVHAHYLFWGELTRMTNPELRNALPSAVLDAFKDAAKAALRARDSRDYTRKEKLLKTLGLTTTEGVPSFAVLAAARVYRRIYKDVEPEKEEVQGTVEEVQGTVEEASV